MSASDEATIAVIEECPRPDCDWAAFEESIDHPSEITKTRFRAQAAVLRHVILGHYAPKIIEAYKTLPEKVRRALGDKR